jgi:hypothetical protein
MQYGVNLNGRESNSLHLTPSPLPFISPNSGRDLAAVIQPLEVSESTSAHWRRRRENRSIDFCGFFPWDL